MENLSACFAVFGKISLICIPVTFVGVAVNGPRTSAGALGLAAAFGLAAVFAGALAAAGAADAWSTIEPRQHTPWLGRLLGASLLRERGKARMHLPCLHEGMKAIPRERRRPQDIPSRLAVQLEAIAAAAEAWLKDHDRWLTARNLLARKLAGRRSTSRLPALLDYVLTRPIVSAGMIAKELKMTPRAAQDLVAELSLREATGRRRYRAWGIL